MRMLCVMLVVVVAAVAGAAGCSGEKTKVELYVDGFQPENVRFELEDLGPLDRAAVEALKRRPDIDGVLALPDGSCGGPCKVTLVSVFVHNDDDDAHVEPAPVVRLKSPPSREKRQPIAFRGGEINKGRIGRVRWAVEMWPEEKALTATLSSSVQLVVDQPPPTTAPPPTAPAPPATAPGAQP